MVQIPLSFDGCLETQQTSDEKIINRAKKLLLGEDEDLEYKEYIKKGIKYCYENHKFFDKSTVYAIDQSVNNFLKIEKNKGNIQDFIIDDFLDCNQTKTIRYKRYPNDEIVQITINLSYYF